MVIERFFGKGRTDQIQAQAKPRAKDKDKNKDQVETTQTRRGAGATDDVEAAGPRTAATDAPASLVRSGEAAVPEAAPAAPIEVADIPEPTDAEIAIRAYEIWEAQGRPDGCERENWFEAQRQLRAERTPG